MNRMKGQRDHKKQLTDTPKASLRNEMDVWHASPRPKKSDCGNAESKFWYERHKESQKEGKRTPIQETSKRKPRYSSENWLRWEAKNTDFVKDILKKLLLEA